MPEEDNGSRSYIVGLFRMMLVECTITRQLTEHSHFSVNHDKPHDLCTMPDCVSQRKRHLQRELAL